jgi:hypothetical protein
LAPSSIADSPEPAGEPDAYAALGVSPEAEDVVIRAAYRALMNKYAATEGDERRARDLQAAYALVSDPVVRRAYDEHRLGTAQPDPGAAVPVDPGEPLPMARPAPVPSPPVAASPVPNDERVVPPPDDVLPMRRPTPGPASAPLAEAAAFGDEPLAMASLAAVLPPRRRRATLPPLLAALGVAAAAVMVVVVVGGVALPGRSPHGRLEGGPNESTPAAPAAPAPAPAPQAPADQAPALATRDRPTPAPLAPAAPMAPLPDTAQSMAVTRAFYEALGEADGARAASLVIPERRAAGPLSAPRISSFYSMLAAPLRLTSIRPVEPGTVAVRYQYVLPNGRICSGAAHVDTARRADQVMIRAIHTSGDC